METAYIERFWTRLDKSGGPDACWPWTRGTDNAGYGAMWTGSQMERVHRLAYELAVGPIPDGLTIDHLCRNRRCGNPRHLEAIERGENVRRGLIGVLRPVPTTCRNGHPKSAKGTCRICLRAGSLRWYYRHKSPNPRP